MTASSAAGCAGAELSEAKAADVCGTGFIVTPGFGVRETLDRRDRNGDTPGMANAEPQQPNTTQDWPRGRPAGDDRRAVGGQVGAGDAFGARLDGGRRDRG